jgi:hypothetical protein
VGGGADGEAQADGQPLLQLPQKTIELVRIEFSKEEREVHVLLPARTRTLSCSIVDLRLGGAQGAHPYQSVHEARDAAQKVRAPGVCSVRLTDACSRSATRRCS